jgi:ferredoxin
MYHAQEKIVNVPGSPLTGQRGGIHNSVTRAILKPTHMIGGYVQQAYGFNYYGTVGSNRDEFVIVRKLEKVDWLEGEPHTGRRGVRSMKIRAQIGKVLNLDKCIGCHTCSVTCKNVWTSREGMEYAWFNNVETKPGIGYPKDWENQKRWNGGWVRTRNGKIEPSEDGRQVAAAGEDLRQPRPARDRRLLRALHLRLRPPAEAGESKAFPTARPRSLITGERMEKDRMGPELGGNPRRRIRQALARTTTSKASRRRSTASSKTPS